MKRIFTVILLGFVALSVSISTGLGTAVYAKKEGKSCTFCHPGGKTKELTDAGKYYKEHNHSLDGYTAADGK